MVRVCGYLSCSLLSLFLINALRGETIATTTNWRWWRSFIVKLATSQCWKQVENQPFTIASWQNKCTIDIFSTINGLETFHLLWPKINVTVAALAHSDMKTDKTSQQNMAIAWFSHPCLNFILTNRYGVKFVFERVPRCWFWLLPRHMTRPDQGLFSLLPQGRKEETPWQCGCTSWMFFIKVYCPNHLLWVHGIVCNCWSSGIFVTIF